MDSKTPLEQLNYVLEKLLHDRDYWDVKEDFFKENILPEKDEHYIKMILNKLHRDGYIDFMEGEANRKTYITNREAGHNMNIRRNFNGHLFLTEGGYVGRENKLIAQGKAKTDFDKRAEGYANDLSSWTKRLATRTRYLMWATWAVAAGAIGLVVWELWDSCHK